MKYNFYHNTKDVVSRETCRAFEKNGFLRGCKKTFATTVRGRCFAFTFFPYVLRNSTFGNFLFLRRAFR